jgi:hypothetical protein
MGLLPNIAGDRQRINIQIFPPGLFIAGLVQLPVMPTAERHCEFIADFQTNAARLRKSFGTRVRRINASGSFSAQACKQTAHRL